MSRYLRGFAAVVVLASPCLVGQTGSTAELLIERNVQAAPAPKPALRYRLLPELNELNPGNPIQHYMKCMMEQKRFFFDEEAFERREKLLSMPLKELPARDLNEYGRYALKQADWAARLDSPDWQILLKLKSDGIALLLPEVQQIRSLARGLQVRFRVEIAQSRFDDAIRTAKTMFAIARHLGKHPTIIGNLVGMSIASMTIYHLDEMLEQPGCPNLYWALTNLPSPLIPLDLGMDGERVVLEGFFRGLDDNAPMSKDQIKKFLEGKDDLLELGDGKSSKPGVRAWLDTRIKDETAVSAARKRLAEAGLSAERLSRFPGDQVILLDEKREVWSRFDDVMKTIHFPFWQFQALGTQQSSKPSPALFADAILPATLSARQAQGRVDQRIAALRHVEALRLHAAEHKGTWPAKLSDVSVPLPVDPFTGRPFRYEVKNNTAHVRGSPPSGLEKNPHFNIHYQVTLQK